MRQRPILRTGLALIAIGVLAVVSLLIYNRGLEDTVPFILYLAAWSAIPLGVLLCLVAVCLNLIKGRGNSSR
jgi:ABC-type sulfate transport system permease subunit